MANYRLNVKIKQQCDAFLNGMRDIVPVDWLRMFSEKELQWLISGSDQPIDVQDLKNHCQYAGGFIMFRVFYLFTNTVALVKVYIID